MKMKVEDLYKILEATHTPEEMEKLKQETIHNFESREGDVLACKKCGIEYKRGFWDFYQLCPPCFEEFDKKKMEERFKKYNNNESKS